MRVAGLVLADGVELLPDGRVSVTAGWPEYFWANEIPGELTIPVAVIIDDDGSDAAIDLVLSVSCGGQKLLAQPISLQAAQRRSIYEPPGAPRYRSFGIGLVYQVQSVGAHEVSLATPSGALVSNVLFSVVLKEP